MKRMITLVAAVLVLAAAPASALTKAKMQAVALAVTDAGYDAQLTKNADTTWTVRARSSSANVPIAAANDLALAQGVQAFVSSAEFGPMTLAKMQAVTTAITNAGFSAAASQVGGGLWRVRASSSSVDIPTSSVAALASAQAVPAFISDVEYR